MILKLFNSMRLIWAAPCYFWNNLRSFQPIKAFRSRVAFSYKQISLAQIFA